MQFFYQFPQRTERLVLISSGGLGREVSPLLRGAALPGVGGAAVGWPRTRGVSTRSAAPASGCAPAARGKGVYLQAVARALRPLEEPRRARGVPADAALGDRRPRPAGQRPRPPLPARATMPTLIVWGERDRTIPIAHGREAHAAIPDCRFETLPRRGPLPPPRRPGRRSPRCCATSSTTTEPGADRGRRLGRDHRAALAAQPP